MRGVSKYGFCFSLAVLWSFVNWDALATYLWSLRPGDCAYFSCWATSCLKRAVYSFRLSWKFPWSQPLPRECTPRWPENPCAWFSAWPGPAAFWGAAARCGWPARSRWGSDKCIAGYSSCISPSSHHLAAGSKKMGTEAHTWKSQLCSDLTRRS